MIIKRPEELKRINEAPRWSMVYGRRKTGKTFLIKNFIKYDEYFFVKKDRAVLTKENEPLSYDAFIERFKQLIKENKTVIIDEFHRLGEDFFELMHAMDKKGRLILLSSTLYLSKKLIAEKSPLLGLFAEINIQNIKLKDCLKALEKTHQNKKDKLELAVLMSEPITAEYVDTSIKSRETIAKIITNTIKTVPALVGEIFLEEERELSTVYETILRAISAGKITSAEITSYIFSKKLIKKDDPSAVQQYLVNLIDFGIIKKIKVYNKARFVYKIKSPLIRIYFYADEKYNISERTINEKEIMPIINEIMPKIVEDHVREIISEKNGLIENVFEAKDFDIDGILLKFTKPEIALEVKWKKINAEDIKKAETNLEKIETKRKIIFVPDKEGIKTKLETMDVEDL